VGTIERGEVWTQKVLRPLLKYVIKYVLAWLHTDKKENQIFLIYKEIQSGAVAKS
jgi:hypothetical protein